MRILLGMSALVLVAILWAMFSILHHIRQGRRRNRFAREQQPDSAAQSQPALATASPPPPPPALTPLPARFAAPAIDPPSRVLPAAPLPPAPAAAAPLQAAVKRPSPPPLPQQPAPQSLRIMEFVPEPPATAVPPPPVSKLLRRPVRSATPPRPAVAAAASGRPAWDYFNKDMGDLSDPTPSRIRDRVRPR